MCMAKCDHPTLQHIRQRAYDSSIVRFSNDITSPYLPIDKKHPYSWLVEENTLNRFTIKVPKHISTKSSICNAREFDVRTNNAINVAQHIILYMRCRNNMKSICIWNRINALHRWHLMACEVSRCCGMFSYLYGYICM